MRTAIPVYHYHQQEIFEHEITALFNPSWQLVGFMQDLKNHHDYICVDVAGKSVIIKNFEGQLRAFHNVCKHRFNRICNHAKGNGLLQCPYHGWTYDKDGLAYAIPNRKQFSHLTDENLKLDAYSVSVCGEFIFVNRKSDSQSLTDYLSSYERLLLEISAAMGNKIDENIMTIDANWKLVVENTLEEYHVQYIHPESFNRLGIQSKQYTYDTVHSSMYASIESQLDKNAALKNALASRPMKINGYHHHFIFPNLTIATGHGASFSIQRIMPISPQQTQFTSYVFSTKLLTENITATKLIEALNTSVAQFNRRVFDEDKLICEQVQKGVSELPYDARGFLCKDEERLHAFQKAYMAWSSL